MFHARPDYARFQDPLNKIPEDEPVFLIRAQDICAPVAMQAWIDMAEISGVDTYMIGVVKDHLERMKEWQLTHNVKVPDL